MKHAQPKVTYTLVDVDLKEKTGVLRVKNEGKHHGYRLDVTVSGQLIGKIKYAQDHPKARKFVDIPFTSTLKSPEFEENPFKLIKFTKTGRDDSFHLQLVTDKGFWFKTYIDAMNNRVDELVGKYWRKDQFIRFWVIDLDKKKA